MAMDRDEMVDFLFGTLGRVMRRHKAALARKEAEERGVFDDDDDDDDDGLVALAHLRSQGRLDGPLGTPAPQNDLIARAKAELADLRQREELARLKAEIRKQRSATAAAESIEDQCTDGGEELVRLKAEIDKQRTRTATAEDDASNSPAAEAAIVREPVIEAAKEDDDDRRDAIEAMGELTLGCGVAAEGSAESKALVTRDDQVDDSDDNDETDAGDDNDDDDDDPVDAHPLLLGQRALRRGDPRTALDLFTSVIEETRPAHKRAPKDTTIAVGLCQSLRAAATARLGLADFAGAIRDINEAVDVAISLHEKAASAEALTEVAASLCDKVEVLLAVGDRQGATILAGEGVRVLKRGLRRHTSRPAVALFERLRSLRAALTRRQVG